MSGATSGTTSWTPALADILIECYERVGVRAGALAQEHYTSGRRSMNLVNSRWSNRGINLWKVALTSVLMPQGQIVYPVATNVLNVLDTYLRQYQVGAPVNVTPMFSTTAGSDVVTIEQPGQAAAAGYYISIGVPVSVGGIVLLGFYQVLSVASGSLYSIVAASAATATVVNGGAVPAFTTIAGSLGVSVALADHGYLAGQSFTVQVPTNVGGIVLQGPYTIASIADADNFTITAPFAAGSNATVSENGGETSIAQQATIEGFTQSADYTDLLLYPLSRNDYAAVPDKLQQGRPTSYWFDRTPPNQSIYVWPAPDANGPYQLNYYTFNQIQDSVPESGQVGDMPQRFFEAYCADVAAHLAMKWAPPRMKDLAAYAMATWQEASDEDREKVSAYLTPDLSGYWNG